jgi:hypothetical protein
MMKSLSNLLKLLFSAPEQKMPSRNRFDRDLVVCDNQQWEGGRHLSFTELANCKCEKCREADRNVG